MWAICLILAISFVGNIIQYFELRRLHQSLYGLQEKFSDAQDAADGAKSNTEDLKDQNEEIKNDLDDLKSSRE